MQINKQLYKEVFDGLRKKGYHVFNLSFELISLDIQDKQDITQVPLCFCVRVTLDVTGSGYYKNSMMVAIDLPENSTSKDVVNKICVCVGVRLAQQRAGDEFAKKQAEYRNELLRIELQHLKHEDFVSEVEKLQQKYMGS